MQWIAGGEYWRYFGYEGFVAATHFPAAVLKANRPEESHAYREDQETSHP
jgi:hypothetical protein